MIIGGSMSLTVTLKVHRLKLPAESVATQTTGVTPTLKLNPGGGTQVVGKMPPQLSLATGTA